MKPLAAATSTMERSGIREVMDQALKLPDVIHLEIGQPDFATPDHIIEAAHQAAVEGYTRYTPNAGLPSLRRAIAEKVQSWNGLAASEENVVVTPGAVFAMASCLLDSFD